MKGKKTESEQPGINRNSVLILASGIGTRIDAASRKVGTRKNAAIAAGVSDDMLYRYIREQSAPSFEAMVGLAKAAGVSLEWLASGEEPKPANDVREDSNTYIVSSPLSNTPYQEVLDDIELVVREVEQIMLEQRKTMAPASKGKLMALVFDWLVTREEMEDESIEPQILRLIRFGGT